MINHTFAGTDAQINFSGQYSDVNEFYNGADEETVFKVDQSHLTDQSISGGSEHLSFSFVTREGS